MISLMCWVYAVNWEGPTMEPSGTSHISLVSTDTDPTHAIDPSHCQSDRNGTKSLLRRGLQSASPRHPSQFHDQPIRTRYSSPTGPLHIHVQWPLHGRSHWRLLSPLFQCSNVACMLTGILEADYVQKRGSWNAVLLDALISLTRNLYLRTVSMILCQKGLGSVSWEQVSQLPFWHQLENMLHGRNDLPTS